MDFIYHHIGFNRSRHEGYKQTISQVNWMASNKNNSLKQEEVLIKTSNTKLSLYDGTTTQNHNIYTGIILFLTYQ